MAEAHIGEGEGTVGAAAAWLTAGVVFGRVSRTGTPRRTAESLEMWLIVAWALEHVVVVGVVHIKRGRTCT